MMRAELTLSLLMKLSRGSSLPPGHTRARHSPACHATSYHVMLLLPPFPKKQNFFTLRPFGCIKMIKKQFSFTFLALRGLGTFAIYLGVWGPDSRLPAKLFIYQIKRSVNKQNGVASSLNFWWCHTARLLPDMTIVLFKNLNVPHIKQPQSCALA